MALGPDHSDVWYVGFIVDCRVQYDKANFLVELFAVCLGMDIDVSRNKGEGCLYQQLSKLLSPMLFQDSDTFELGSLFGPSDPQRSRRHTIKGEKEVCACLVLAVEVDRLIDPLAFNEDTPAYSLALENTWMGFLFCR